MNKGFAPSRAEKEIRHFIKIQRLKNVTGATKLECEQVLSECRGEVEKAIELLRYKINNK